MLIGRPGQAVVGADSGDIAHAGDVVDILQVEELVMAELLGLDQQVAEAPILDGVGAEHIVERALADAVDVLAVLAGGVGVDVDADDHLATVTDDGDGEVVEESAVDIVHAVDNDGAEDDRYAARGAHGLHDGAGAEPMAAAVVEVGGHNDGGDTKLLEGLGAEVTLQKLTHATAVEQPRGGHLHAGKLGELTPGEHFADLVRGVSVGPQHSRYGAGTGTHNDVGTNTALLQKLKDAHIGQSFGSTAAQGQSESVGLPRLDPFQ